MFDPLLCEKYVESLIQLDEVERALVVLNNIPAYFRDHVPDNLVRIKKDILSSLCTSHAYLCSDLDSNVTEDKALAILGHTLRGQLIEAEVSRYNKNGETPHIVDLGPGEYYVPIGLLKKGYQFSYWSVGLDRKAEAAARPLIESVLKNEKKSPTIFLALEVIEHLPSTQDIVIECLRHCGAFPERIHLSTPCYTYDENEKEWRKPCGLPHLRAYTPKEFHEEVSKLFPGYQWIQGHGQIMSLRGSRLDKIDLGFQEEFSKINNLGG